MFVLTKQCMLSWPNGDEPHLREHFGCGLTFLNNFEGVQDLVITEAVQQLPQEDQRFNKIAKC